VKEIIALVIVVYVLLYVLEVVNALYRSFVHGHATDLQDAVAQKGGTINILNLPLLLRWLFVAALVGSRTVSLLFHEGMHAAGQALALGRPRVALCKNGGYAEATPWSSSWPASYGFFFGSQLLQGAISMAPLLGGVAVFYGVALLATPLDFDFVGRMSEALEAGAGSAGALGLGKALLAVFTATLQAVVRAPWWGVAAVLLVGVLLGNSLTGSSTDFSISIFALLAYGLATVGGSAALLYSPLPLAVLFGAGLVLVLGFLKLSGGKRRWPDLFGTTGLSLMLLAALSGVGALGAAPVAGLQRGLSFLVFLLVYALVVYAVAVALMVAISVVTLDLGPIGLALKNLPGELASAFRPFDTCLDCNMHFREACDGCGRTPEEIERELAARPNALEAARQKLGSG